jgi:hypothetical protein
MYAVSANVAAEVYAASMRFLLDVATANFPMLSQGRCTQYQQTSPQKYMQQACCFCGMCVAMDVPLRCHRELLRSSPDPRRCIRLDILRRIDLQQNQFDINPIRVLLHSRPGRTTFSIDSTTELIGGSTQVSTRGKTPYYIGLSMTRSSPSPCTITDRGTCHGQQVQKKLKKWKLNITINAEPSCGGTI